MKFTIGNLSPAAVIPPASDPYFQYVSLLMGFNGTNGQTTFTDDSPVAQAVSVFGAAQVDTAVKKFGTGSLKCAVAATDYVQVPDNVAFTMGSGDFTMECWWNPQVTGNHYIMGQGSAGGFAWNGLMVESNSQRWAQRDFAEVYETTNAFVYSVDTWYFMVIERAGNIARLYRDGVMVRKVTIGTTALTDATDPFRMGSFWPGVGMVAHLDETRVTKGIARYNNDAGFATPTAEFPRGGPPWFLTGPAASGNTWVGQVLTLTGTDNAVSRSYQWKRNGSAISGETASTYTLVSGDIGATITCTIVLTNTYGTATVTSNGLGPITATNPLAAVRGSRTAYVNNTNSATVTLPTGSAAGDLCYGFTSHGYATTCPTGWQPISDQQGSNYNGMVFQKVLTAADITAASVTVAFVGSYYGTVTLVTMIGNLQIKAIADGRNGSGAASRTIATNTLPAGGDNIILFGSARVNAAVTSSSYPNALQSNINTESSSVAVFGTAGSGGAQSGTVNFAGAPSGDYEALVDMSTTTVSTLYTNTGGTGNRSALITVTAVNIAAGASTPQDLVDGSQADSYWWLNGTGNGTGWLLFAFSTAKVIDQFRMYESTPSTAQGVWRCEGSNDNSTWTQIGADFTLIGNTAFPVPNTTAYLWYRFRHMSGARSQSPYIREFEFKIA